MMVCVQKWPDPEDLDILPQWRASCASWQRAIGIREGPQQKTRLPNPNQELITLNICLYRSTRPTAITCVYLGPVAPVRQRTKVKLITFRRNPFTTKQKWSRDESGYYLCMELLQEDMTSSLPPPWASPTMTARSAITIS